MKYTEEQYLEYAMNQPMTDGEEIRSFFEELDKPKTVKLVVEIPEAKYEALKKGTTMGMALGTLENAILNGIPVQKGHWVFPNPSTKMICECSVCGGNGTEFGKDKFCRNCGAEMSELDKTESEV